MGTFAVPPEVVAWRRHLHAHPELSYEEHETAAWVEERLHEFGIETWRPTVTSIVGTITGTRAAPAASGVTCIAVRADMDALPVQEQTGLPFASTVPGVMHACGHDTHTAMLLGTAKVLSENRHLFHGTVKLFFQHAEEKNPGGAKFMIEKGCLDGVQQVYGFHVMNGPAGTVQVPKGCASSSAGGFFLTIQGRGSHGSMPQAGIDPVLCGAQIIVALNHIASRNIDPKKFTVVNAGSFSGGTAPNVIPDTARLGCSVRTYSKEEAQIAYRRCEEVVAGICAAYGCTYEFEWVPPYDVVYNDPTLVDTVLASTRTALGGEEKAWECEAFSGSEDFAEFTNRLPGVFVLINGGNAEEGFPFQNHHPGFTVKESETLEAGVRTEVQIVLDALGG